MKIICVHEGSFHADDALGTAILLALHPAAKVVRSRQPEVWATCDALVDVGDEYDPARHRYDHHQKSFRERRDNGIPYASSGLVWRHFGVQYVQHICPELENAQDALAIASRVDSKLIQHADAVDNGVMVPGPAPFNLSGIIDTLNATWRDSATDDDARFMEAVAFAGTVLRNLVRASSAEFLGERLVRTAPTRCEGKVLILDTARVAYDAEVINSMPKVLFVVYPESRGNQYQVRVVAKVLNTFEARENLPEAWAGLRGEELAAVTGVHDAVFAHTGRFIAGAVSRRGALRLAELAVEALG